MHSSALFSFPLVQTSIPDSECNLDANCLSRCSTELFSEASWEQVDKQDTEVSRPLAAGHGGVGRGARLEPVAEES